MFLRNTGLEIYGTHKSLYIQANSAHFQSMTAYELLHHHLINDESKEMGCFTYISIYRRFWDREVGIYSVNAADNFCESDFFQSGNGRWDLNWIIISGGHKYFSPCVPAPFRSSLQVIGCIGQADEHTPRLAGHTGRWGVSFRTDTTKRSW